MKLPFHFIIFACLIVLLAGCATSSDLASAGGKPEPGNRMHLGYPVSTLTSVVMMSDFKWWPELSGYYLPAGVYKAESEDTNGVFFKSPNGFKSESVTGAMDTKGGIYLPKENTVGISGHVYLWLPVFGGRWATYQLPDQFFSHYGETWRIVQSNELPDTALEPKTSPP